MTFEMETTDCQVMKTICLEVKIACLGKGMTDIKVNSTQTHHYVGYTGFAQ